MPVPLPVSGGGGRCGGAKPDNAVGRSKRNRANRTDGCLVGDIPTKNRPSNRRSQLYTTWRENAHQVQDLRSVADTGEASQMGYSVALTEAGSSRQGR